MSDSTANTPGKLSRTQRVTRQTLWIILHVLLPAIVLLVAGGVVYNMFLTPPQPERRQASKYAPLVELAQAQRADEPVSVHAAGVVLPAQQIDLKAQVGGRIEFMTPGLEPGARFKRGDLLFRIEEADYRLAREQRESEVEAAKARVTEAQQNKVQAERDLAIEQANAAVAKREYEIFGGDLSEEDRRLVLREPQLAAALAAIESAKAQIETAKANLKQAQSSLDVAILNEKRTAITAPFDAVVVERLVDQGETVSTTTPLITLVGTDTYWVELAVPEKDLKWIRMPTEAQPGSSVHFSNDSAWGIGAERIGQVIRVVPTVDAAGRMARVLCEITDPLSIAATEAGSGNAGPNILVGSYLSARIEGITTPQAVIVPRDWIREGDYVWVMTDDSKLSIRKIQTVYRGPDHLLVSSGLEPGERIVTTDLAAPVDGMDLRLAAKRSGTAVQPAPDTPREASGNPQHLPATN